MVKIFLDTNILIDLLQNRRTVALPQSGTFLFFSPLSLHILLYVTKERVPYTQLEELIQQFTLVPLSERITSLALHGPTSDFEDNVQLHSAVDCDIFLTHDKALVALKVFGKTRILSDMPK